MGLVMVVQTRTIAENAGSINVIEVPESLPNEVFENESILILESKLRKLENKIVVTAQSILNLITELKTHTTAIDRFENYYISMRELVVSQNDRIDDLENKDNLTSTKLYDIIDTIEKQETKTSTKLGNVVENFERKIIETTQKIDDVTKEVEKNQTETMGKLDSITNKMGQVEILANNHLGSINESYRRTENQSPDELIRIGYDSISANMRQELLDKLKNSTFEFFERIILELLPNMSYGKGEIINRSMDGKIDGFINPDRFGFDKIYFQAHRIKDNTPITAPMISNFVGTLEIAGVNKGVLITTSKYK
jgi:restriction system protein